MSAVVSTALLAPGDFGLEDFLAGRNAVVQLDMGAGIEIGAPVPDAADGPAPGFRPRAIDLALRVIERLELEKGARYGLVLGLSNVHAQPSYLQHALDHRNDPHGMQSAAAFRGQGPLDTIADALRITGPRIRIDSACASGSDALILGKEWIDSGYVEDVVVVAAASMLDPVGLALFRNLRALSRSSEITASRPFDRLRDGFVMGEGAAALWLSGRRPRTPKAWIAGTGRSMNAFKMTDMPREPEAMLACCRSAAGGREDSIGYVSAHGTSTPANDRAESWVHHRLFGTRAAQVPLSSLKSMTGHCLGASSLIELIITIEAMASRRFPPTLHLEHPDPECDLDYLADGQVSLDCQLALTNAYAFGGQNSSVLLSREAPE